MPEITDMHAHISCLQELEAGKIGLQEALLRGMDELIFRQRHGIRTFVSTGRPCEWKYLQRLLQPKDVFLSEIKKYTGTDLEYQLKPDFVRVSFGIHPWYADQFEPADQRDAFQMCDAVGEIGMDSVWTKVPLSVQRKQLEAQLQIAADLKKPVVLHTKGCESDIAEIVREFPGKILIHWFSGTYAELEKFLMLDCYFTLGPDLTAACDTNSRKRTGGRPAVDTGVAPEQGSAGPSALTEKAGLYQTMLHEIPENRLFLETDGRSSVEWALGCPVANDQIPAVLFANLYTAAAAKQCTASAFSRILEENFHRFLAAG